MRDIAALKPLQEQGQTLAMRLTQLGRRRHDFIHGAAWQLEQGRFEAISIAVKAGDYAIQNRRFDQGDALILSNEIVSLQDEMAAFMLKIVGIFQR